MTQATTKPVPCQVRSKTQSPCLHRAVAEIRGMPFCEGCAREQEAYFAIGELTQEPQLLRGEPLGNTLDEMLERLRRQRGWPCSSELLRSPECGRNRASGAHEKLSFWS